MKCSYSAGHEKCTFEANFGLCADMFPYEDFEILSPSVPPYPEKRNHHSFVIINPTVVIDTSKERSSRLIKFGNPKNLILLKKKQAYLNVSAVMFCKQCLAYTVHIDYYYHAIYKHSNRFQCLYISVNYMHIYFSTLRGSTSSFLSIGLLIASVGFNYVGTALFIFICQKV